jgi:hypothetical protein
VSAAVLRRCEELNRQATVYRHELASKLDALRIEEERYRALASAMRRQRGLHHEVDDSGGFVTVNYADDPHYPPGSSFVSYGKRGTDRHVTVIYDSDGNQIAELP